VSETPRDYSLRRLRELGESLEPISELLSRHPLCVYATGSYGRLEAWTGSDADLFFLCDDADDSQRVPWTTFVRLSSLLIETTQEMGFPPFSGDGKYLDILYVGEMERVLGSREDDSLNAFTARMLLLLESQPVYADSAYAGLLERIVGFYYRDYADHADEFVPLILLNDILRFWRTLTLNYEHHRLKLLPLVGEELQRKKADSALKNYKLKVSRLATCFSMVANLGAEPVPVTPQTVLDLCQLTPTERFERLRAHGAEADRLVGELLEIHDAFLASVRRPEEDLLAEFAAGETRKTALHDANRYGDIIFSLLQEVTPPERMRYLVI
jgi:predicted nucleotidyltransferase